MIFMKRILCLVTLFVCLCGSVWAMTFTGTKDLAYFANNTMNGPTPKVTTKAQNGETVAFTYYGKYVKLTSADGTHDYLSFITNDKKIAAFKIKTIQTIEPNLKLWEIKARSNAMNGHANDGFWLVGQKNGKYVTYISQDSLTEMGYGQDSAYPVHSLRTRVINGHYYIDASHAREDAASSEDLRTVIDFSVRADWDANAQWFDLYYLTI